MRTVSTRCSLPRGLRLRGPPRRSQRLMSFGSWYQLLQHQERSFLATRPVRVLIFKVPRSSRTTTARIVAPRRPNKNQPTKNATTDPTPMRDQSMVIGMVPTSQRTEDRGQEPACDRRDDPHHDRDREG